MDPCSVGQVCPVRLDMLGDQFRRYRLRLPQAVAAMAESLRRWGQCSPIVATLREEKPQVQGVRPIQGVRPEWHDVKRNPNNGKELGLNNGIAECEVYI